MTLCHDPSGALFPHGAEKLRCLSTPAGACYAEATQKSWVRHQRILNGFHPRWRGRAESASGSTL